VRSFLLGRDALAVGAQPRAAVAGDDLLSDFRQRSCHGITAMFAKLTMTTKDTRS
jgi:hypothetical protein